MLKIDQLSHVTLICKDIERTGEFLRKIFGAVERYRRPQDRFFKVGDIWIVIIEGEPITKTYNHIAFQCDNKKFTKIRKELENLGLKVLEGRKRRSYEGDSLYFYDYDNHLFELHSGDLEKRIKGFMGSDS